MKPLDEAGEQALLELGQSLVSSGYHFITPTPATHERVNARPANALARDLGGVFGWSRPFKPWLIPRSMLECLAHADAIIEQPDGLLRSAIRFSSLGSRIFAHSAFPTQAADSVFFGPDTYRFAAALERLARPAEVAVDIGCGSGAGGLSLGRKVSRLICADINPRALELAKVNAALNGNAKVDFALGDLYSAFPGQVDLIIANPPYLADELGRAYRDGGGALGMGLSQRIVAEGLPRLREGGQLILYTASPIRDGHDALWAWLAPLLEERGLAYSYEELDPDVFGEELERPRYAEVDRIAVVCLVVEVSTRH